MKLFRPKRWSVVDLALLKWSCVLAGMIAGAYTAEFTQRVAWVLALFAVVLAIKPVTSYFREAAS